MSAKLFRVILWLTPCLLVSSSPTLALNATLVNARIAPENDTIAPKEVGFWAVYNTTEKQSSTRPADDFPCCLMVKTKLTVLDGNETLLEVPAWAENQNDTCWENGQQLRLRWSLQNRTLDESFDSSLVMSFKTGPDSQPPVQYDEDNVWIWMSELRLASPRLKIELNSTKLFESPRLFAYTCRGNSVDVPATAQFFHNGTSVETRSVQMRFHHLKIEAFRHNRFYAEFTHMKFNCVNGWPYSQVPLIVSLVMAAVALLVTIMFVIRYRRSKERDSSIESTPEDSQYHADDEQLISE